MLWASSGPSCWGRRSAPRKGPLPTVCRCGCVAAAVYCAGSCAGWLGSWALPSFFCFMAFSRQALHSGRPTYFCAMAAHWAAGISSPVDFCTLSLMRPPQSAHRMRTGSLPSFSQAARSLPSCGVMTAPNPSRKVTSLLVVAMWLRAMFSTMSNSYSRFSRWMGASPSLTGSILPRSLGCRA